MKVPPVTAPWRALVPFQRERAINPALTITARLSANDRPGRPLPPQLKAAFTAAWLTLPGADRGPRHQDGDESARVHAPEYHRGCGWRAPCRPAGARLRALARPADRPARSGRGRYLRQARDRARRDARHAGDRGARRSRRARRRFLRTGADQ